MEECFGHGGVGAADADHDLVRAHEDVVEAVLQYGCMQEGRQWRRHNDQAPDPSNPNAVARIARWLTERMTAR